MYKRIKKYLLKRFTKQYWQSNRSNAWHSKRKNEAHNDFTAFSDAVCTKIENLPYQTVIEIGTGAGTLITLMSQKLPNYANFIGIDINKKQIVENQITYKNLTNVEFVFMDIEKYIENTNLNNAVIVSQNTLDYFPKNDLKKLLSLIHTKIENVAILVSSVKNTLQLHDSVETTEPGFKVYHHNYPSLLEATGYKSISIDSFGEKGDLIMVTGHKHSQ